MDEPVTVHIPTTPTLTVEEADNLKSQLTELASKLTQAQNEKKAQGSHDNHHF